MEAAKNRFAMIDGSGDLLPGKRHVRSLRAGVGSSIATHRVGMKLGHELFKFSEATRLPGRDSDSYALAISEEVMGYSS